MKKPTKPTLRDLPLDRVDPNPNQPRKQFEEKALAELAESIAENGLLQPIKVRPVADGRFQIVCGERRWRAHKLAGKKTIRCVVEVLTDDEVADQAILENLQRADISPMEEAGAFQARLDDGVDVAELARRLGVSAVRIQFRVALLRLEPEFQDAFQRGMLDKWQAHYMARLSASYQRLMFDAIRKGTCRTRGQAQALAERLTILQKNPDALLEPVPLSLFDEAPADAAKSQALSRLEQQIAAVTDMVCRSFDENQVALAGKVSPRNAAVLAAKLELLEKHLRKMRGALERTSMAA